MWELLNMLNPKILHLGALTAKKSFCITMLVKFSWMRDGVEGETKYPKIPRSVEKETKASQTAIHDSTYPNPHDFVSWKQTI
jgi:hypothetical protein